MSRSVLVLVGAMACADAAPGRSDTPGPSGPIAAEFLHTAGNSNYEQSFGVAPMPDGGAAITGWYTYDVDFGGGARPGNGADIFVARYGPNGAWRWDSTYNTFDAPCEGRAIAADADGNVYAGGYWGASNRGSEIDFGGGLRTTSGIAAFVLALGPDGAYRWDLTFGGGGAANEVRGIAAAPDGDVVVTGMFEGTVDFGDGPRTSASSGDTFLTRYSAAGVLRWARTYDTTVNGLAVDATSGGVLIGGLFRTSVDFGNGVPDAPNGTPSGFVLALDPTGAYDWHADTAAMLVDDVALAPNGDVLLSGGSGGALLVRQLDSEGVEGWTTTVTGSQGVYPAEIAVGEDGTVHVAGSFRGDVDFGDGARTSAGGADLFVASYGGEAGSWQSDWTFGSSYDSAGADAVLDIVATYRGYAITGTFTETVDFGPPFGTHTAAGGTDLFVLRQVVR